MYNKDFWELWNEIKDVAERKMSKWYGNDGCYVMPISTADYMRLSPDDLIAYWEKESALQFSEECEAWFVELKRKFDELSVTEFIIEKPLRYIIDLMEDADKNHNRIYTFADFFEESLENLMDRRFQVLWKIYEEMLCRLASFFLTLKTLQVIILIRK